MQGREAPRSRSLYYSGSRRRLSCRVLLNDGGQQRLRRLEPRAKRSWPASQTASAAVPHCAVQPDAYEGFIVSAIQP
jgi:hypothetical protein